MFVVDALVEPLRRLMPTAIGRRHPVIIGGAMPWIGLWRRDVAFTARPPVTFSRHPSMMGAAGCRGSTSGPCCITRA
jgi:hypothetical protein